MKRFAIMWDGGYGESCDFVEAESLDEAKYQARDLAIEEAMNNIVYEAVEAIDEIEDAEDYFVM